MASDAGGGPRSLEVQRARAEERRQRLEEFRYQLEARKYELEQRKHELEKTKVINDALKHFITVITALLFILAYFEMFSSRNELSRFVRYLFRQSLMTNGR